MNINAMMSNSNKVVSYCHATRLLLSLYKKRIYQVINFGYFPFRLMSQISS